MAVSPKKVKKSAPSRKSAPKGVPIGQSESDDMPRKKLTKKGKC